MGKIIKATNLKALPQGKKIVLVGGGFDILHVGHTTFLQKAKRQGDCLVVLLESDASLKNLKGEDRPANPQINRAEVLSALSSVDYVILLPPNMQNDDYDNLVIKISPAILATSRDDKKIIHKIRQSRLTKAKLKTVTSLIKGKSSSNLLKLLYDKKF